MLFLENKGCQEDTLRLTGMTFFEDPSVRYLLILLLLTETKSSFNSQTGMHAVSGGRVIAPSAGISLDKGCGTLQRDGGWSTLLCCRHFYLEETDSPWHWQFLDSCSAITYVFMRNLIKNSNYVTTTISFFHRCNKVILLFWGWLENSSGHALYLKQGSL